MAHAVIIKAQSRDGVAGVLESLHTLTYVISSILVLSGGRGERSRSSSNCNSAYSIPSMLSSLGCKRSRTSTSH